MNTVFPRLKEIEIFIIKNVSKSICRNLKATNVYYRKIFIKKVEKSAIKGFNEIPPKVRASPYKKFC